MTLNFYPHYWRSADYRCVLPPLVYSVLGNQPPGFMPAMPTLYQLSIHILSPSLQLLPLPGPASAASASQWAGSAGWSHRPVRGERGQWGATSPILECRDRRKKPDHRVLLWVGKLAYQKDGRTSLWTSVARNKRPLGQWQYPAKVSMSTPLA